MAFSEVREYIPGDEIRAIDWNVTARFNHPFVKIFEEERELTVMLLADVSASQSFGTNQQLKRGMITEICAVLAFSAIRNNDNVGVILFSETVEKFIPPKKGTTHILRIIRELLEFQPENKGTNISGALKYLTNAIKKRSIAFLISDFLAGSYEDAMKIANRKHDLVALRIFDERENEMPSAGLIRFVDPESGKKSWIDTGSKSARVGFRAWALRHEKETLSLFTKCGVDYTSISTKTGYVKPLMGLFKRRESRQ